jgi:hypothetical protein
MACVTPSDTHGKRHMVSAGGRASRGYRPGMLPTVPTPQGCHERFNNTNHDSPRPYTPSIRPRFLNGTHHQP